MFLPGKDCSICGEKHAISRFYCDSHLSAFGPSCSRMTEQTGACFETLGLSSSTWCLSVAASAIKNHSGKPQHCKPVESCRLYCGLQEHCTSVDDHRDAECSNVALDSFHGNYLHLRSISSSGAETQNCLLVFWFFFARGSFFRFRR